MAADGAGMADPLLRDHGPVPDPRRPRRLLRVGLPRRCARGGSPAGPGRARGPRGRRHAAGSFHRPCGATPALATASRHRRCPRSTPSRRLPGGPAFFTDSKPSCSSARPPRSGLRRPRPGVVGGGALDGPRGRGAAPGEATGAGRRAERQAVREADALAEACPAAAGRRHRTTGRVRAAARARPGDRAADRGPQLLDRPDGAGSPARVRHARRRPAGPRGRLRSSRRHPVSAPRRGPGVILAPEDRRAVVAARRAEHAHFAGIRPPRVIGRPTTDEPNDRFDGVRFAKDDEAVVRGTGASAGIVTRPCPSSSSVPTTSSASSRATSSSRPHRTHPGSRCLRSPEGSSRTPAACCRMRPSSPASSACRRSSAPVMPRPGSPMARCSSSTERPGSSGCGERANRRTRDAGRASDQPTTPARRPDARSRVRRDPRAAQFDDARGGTAEHHDRVRR